MRRKTDNKTNHAPAGSSFRLELADQYWIRGVGSDFANEDPTSHGRVSVRVNGVEISRSGHEHTDYGVNQSAVRLLQTVFIDHTPQKWQPGSRFNPVFFHGCDIFGTCPNCIIDYRVTHHADAAVTLDRFYVTGGDEDADPDEYIDMTVRIPRREYALQVLEFSKKAFDFLPEEKGMEHEMPAYRRLRAEHAALIKMVEEYLKTGIVTTQMKNRAAGFSVDGVG